MEDKTPSSIGKTSPPPHQANPLFPKISKFQKLKKITISTPF